MPSPATPKLPSTSSTRKVAATPTQASAHQQGAAYKPKKGLGWFLSYVFLLSLLGLLVWLITRLMGAQDLSGVEGREGEVRAGQDLRLRLEATLQRQGELSLSEAELNAYLQRTLKLQQEGMLASQMEAEAIWVDLQPSNALVYLERRWGAEEGEGAEGKAQTMAVRVGYQIEDGRREFQLAKGAWDGVYVGKQALPAGMVMLMKPALDALYTALEEEVELLEKMQDVRIEEGKLIVSARKKE